MCRKAEHTGRQQQRLRQQQQHKGPLLRGLQPVEPGSRVIYTAAHRQPVLLLSPVTVLGHIGATTLAQLWCMLASGSSVLLLLQEDSTAYSLKCNISQDVNYLHQGILLGLVEDRCVQASSRVGLLFGRGGEVQALLLANCQSLWSHPCIAAAAGLGAVPALLTPLTCRCCCRHWWWW